MQDMERGQFPAVESGDLRSEDAKTGLWGFAAGLRGSNLHKTIRTPSAIGDRLRRGIVRWLLPAIYSEVDGGRLRIKKWPPKPEPRKRAEPAVDPADCENVKRFVAACCETDPLPLDRDNPIVRRAKTIDVFAEYRRYCDDLGAKRLSPRCLLEQLDQIGFGKDRDKKHRYLTGLSLTNVQSSQ